MIRLTHTLVTILIGSLMLVGVNCSTSSTIKKHQLLGEWVGTKIFFDTDTLPRPIVLEIKPDGSFQTDNFGYSKYESNWFVEDNLLILDTLKYEVNQSSPEELLIKRESGTKAYYRKAIDQPLTIKDAAIENTAWQCTNPANPFKIYLNYEKIITESPDGSVKVRCWKLHSYNDLQFFYQTGHPKGCNKSANRLQQILRLDDKELIVQNFNTISTEKWSFKKIESTKNDFQKLLLRKQFQRCSSFNLFNCRNLSNFHEKPGIIKQSYLKQFKPVKGNTQSGSLIMKFTVNCSGELGDFNFEGMNTSYKADQYDEKILQQLRDITNSIEGWKGHEIENVTDVDCYAIFVFKFENGKIIELSL